MSKINQSITFKSIPPNTYDWPYEINNNYNGVNPDAQIIKTTQKYFPIKTVFIADIGAGDGRNTLPLAKLGYNIDAFEISKAGRELIQKKAKNLPNLNIFSTDILKEPIKKIYDEIFLSHVTQHFDSKEMKKAFSNLSSGLKKSGIIIFDALIDKHNFVEPCSDKDASEGNYHFKPNFIETLAQKNGLKLINICDFEESKKSKGDYYGANWGFSNPTSPFCKVKEIKLKWFTFKKI